MSLAVLICPEISELSEIKTNIKCTEEGCSSVFLNSSNLEMHLIKTHHKVSSYLDKKQSEVVFHYFCPIDGCKYQLNTQRDVTQLRWFSKMKFLKQHYMKVHKEKEFSCLSCSKKFSSLKDKNYHVECECGRKFICPICRFTYDSRVSLLTHAKRKNHMVSQPDERPAKMPRIALPASSSPRKECYILPKITPDSSVNIAAAALSELSRKIIVKGVDKGVQTNSRRRSCHRTVKKNVLLQTLDSQSRISAETQTMSVYSTRKANKKHERGKCIETQTIQDTDNAVDSEDSIFSNLNSTKSSDLVSIALPNFWKRNESATQTVVLNKYDDIPYLFMSQTNENFEPLKLCQNSDTYTEQFDRLIQQSTILDDTRLCDIETQTELNDNSFVDDCPLLSNNETQTVRISLDDIYSHNCTQTCDGLFDGYVEFADIETQTGWAADISTDFVSAETQTIF